MWLITPETLFGHLSRRLHPAKIAAIPRYLALAHFRVFILSQAQHFTDTADLSDDLVAHVEMHLREQRSIILDTRVVYQILHFFYTEL